MGVNGTHESTNSESGDMHQGRTAHIHEKRTGGFSEQHPRKPLEGAESINDGIETPKEYMKVTSIFSMVREVDKDFLVAFVEAVSQTSNDDLHVLHELGLIMSPEVLRGESETSLFRYVKETYLTYFISQTLFDFGEFLNDPANSQKNMTKEAICLKLNKHLFNLVEKFNTSVLEEKGISLDGIENRVYPDEIPDFDDINDSLTGEVTSVGEAIAPLVVLADYFYKLPSSRTFLERTKQSLRYALNQLIKISK